MKNHKGLIVAVSGVAVVLGAVLALRSGDSPFEPPLPVAAESGLPRASTEEVALDGATAKSDDSTSRVQPDEAALAPASDAWDALYQSSDYFAFVQSAATAALDGDGRAAWLVSRALVECKLVIVAADSRDSSVQGTLAENTALTSRVKRCEGFRDAHPLDALDLPDEAKRPDYWRTIAIASGDGRALVYRAASIAAGVSMDMDPAARTDKYAQILDDLRGAVASKDPEAIATLGSVFMSPAIARDPSQGVAWLLAACELGFDCSQTNPLLGSNCGQVGTCDGTTLTEQYQRGLGPQRFSRLFSDGQDIAYNVRVGNWEGLQQYLAMRL